MSLIEKEQQKHENLSAFLDTEQSESEAVKTIDALLNDSEYREKYFRMQMINDSLNDQVHGSLLIGNMRNRVSSVMQELPAHYIDEAVTLQVASTEDVTNTSWFKRLLGNKVISGVSVAASVMFVTLITLQHFDSGDKNTTIVNNNSLASSGQSEASLIRASSRLPANLAATAAVPAKSEKFKHQYRWIEADPELSRQVRRYINEHETHRAAYRLPPKIQTATWQIKE